MKALCLAVELLASIFTLAGIFVGSTTFWGAVCYLISLVFWWWLVWLKKLWGIIPLNAASTAISTYNLWINL